jgi:hypothetical protein
MRTCVSVLISVFAAGSLLADAKLTHKTKVQLGGVLGTAANVFGGRSAAKDGLTTDVVVKKNRRVSRTGDMAEIVDLDEEKIYHVDYAKKTYKVTTFAEMRKQLEEMKKQAAEQADEKPAEKDPDAPEYEVVFDSENTGEKEEINGYDAKQVIASVTVKEKGKKVEQSGGLVLKADLWMAPRIAAVREHEEFERRYVKKLFGDLGFDPRSTVAISAMAPDLGKAMKKFNDNLQKMDGSAVRTTLTFTTVADPRQRGEDDEDADAAASAANKAVKAFGGFMNRIRKKDSAEAEQAEDGEKGYLFKSNTELVSASASASTSDVAIPSDFKLRK